MKQLMTILLLLCSLLAQSQKANNEIIKGNTAYKKGDFKAAEDAYDAALKIDAKNSTALFNKANALQKQGKLAEAAKQYQAAFQYAKNNYLQAQSLYNKGVAEARQKQWQQAASSFKESLRLNPSDTDARDNLQKALNEIKKLQPKQPDNNQPKEKKKDQEDKPKEKKQEPKMNKQQMENELNKLRNEEKRLQQDLQKQKVKQPSSPEKDW